MFGAQALVAFARDHFLVFQIENLDAAIPIAYLRSPQHQSWQSVMRGDQSEISRPT
jgi:hypothetical protein